MSNLTEIENGYFVGGNSASRRLGRKITASKAGIACLISMIAAVICAPLRARAATVIATITGKVESGTDVTGEFIAPGGNLAGYPYTLVFTMHDTQGVPLYGAWPADCDNGLQSSGLTTPVPKAVLTVNGKSYTFGTHTPTTVSSWVYSFNATAPQTSLAFAFGDSFNNLIRIYGTEEVFGGLNLVSIYACRDWESAFTYNLINPVDLASSYFIFEVQLALATADGLTSPFVEFGEGFLRVQTVNVSGPIGGTPPALSIVSPFLLKASGLGNLDLATLLPKLPNLASAEASGLEADGNSAAIALWATNSDEDVTFTTNNGMTLLPYDPQFLKTPPTEGNASLTIPAVDLIKIGTVLYAAALIQAPPPGVSPSFSDPIIVTAKQGSRSGGLSLRLVPPPVLLVHGIWGDTDSLSSIYDDLVSESPWNHQRSLVIPIKYPKNLAFDSKSTENEFDAGIESALGVLDAKKIVGGRVDIVAHSMGGLVARYYSGLVGPQISYRTLRNREQGAFHEIITLNTPERVRLWPLF